MPDTLTITDNRTGKSYEVPIGYATYPEYGAYRTGHALRDRSRRRKRTSGCSATTPDS
jgi:hypothetical protein